jgi:hypothetical protein
MFEIAASDVRIAPLLKVGETFYLPILSVFIVLFDYVSPYIFFSHHLLEYEQAVHWQ